MLYEFWIMDDGRVDGVDTPQLISEADRTDHCVLVATGSMDTMRRLVCGYPDSVETRIIPVGRN